MTKPSGHDAASLPQTQGQSVVKPLTYEQEVHSILCSAASSMEDLLRYFEAQAKMERGDAKRLTLKCIEHQKYNLRRVRDLIPQALERFIEILETT